MSQPNYFFSVLLNLFVRHLLTSISLEKNFYNFCCDKGPYPLNPWPHEAVEATTNFHDIVREKFYEVHDFLGVIVTSKSTIPPTSRCQVKFYGVFLMHTKIKSSVILGHVVTRRSRGGNDFNKIERKMLPFSGGGGIIKQLSR